MRARLPEGSGVSLSLCTVQKLPPYSAWQLSPAASETRSVITPPAGPVATVGKVPRNDLDGPQYRS